MKKGQIRRATKDIALAKSLVNGAENDVSFLKTIELNEISARKVMTNYYDVLRSILEAIAILDGYKIYAHEAFTDYLKEKGDATIAIKFDRLRKIRNGINYYGKSISVEEVKENIKLIEGVIHQMKEKYLKES